MVIAGQVLGRYGILTREMLARENIPGGCAAVYPVLKAMEETGCIRRGYFVAGRGAAQFAAAGAEDRLRTRRLRDTDGAGCLILAVTDSASPWGSALPWPAMKTDQQLHRTAGALVFVTDGRLLAYLSRNDMHLTTFSESSHDDSADSLIPLTECLVRLAQRERRMLLATIDG